MTQQIHPQQARTAYGPAPMPMPMPMPLPPVPPHHLPGPPPASGPPAPRRRTGAVLGTVAGVVVAAGLGVGAFLAFGTATLDTVDAEAQITRLTADSLGVAPSEVSCPEDVAVEAGATFTCTALLDGQSLDLTVEQTDDEGSITVQSEPGLVRLDVVEAELAAQVGLDADVEVVATCGSDGRRVVVDGVGTPIDCTVAAADDPTESAAVVAVVAADGSVGFELA